MNIKITGRGRYLGRLFDFTGLSAKIAIPSSENIPDDIIFCATRRPFFYTPSDDSRLWFSSGIDPIDGLLNAVNIFAHLDSSKYKILKANNDISGLLNDDMGLIGPINYLCMENDLPTELHKSDGHFIIYCGRAGGGFRFCHPDGIMMIITGKRLEEYLKGFSRTIYLPFDALKPKHTDHKDWLKVFNVVPNYSDFIRHILSITQNKKLNSSEKFSLTFGMWNFSVNNMIIRNAIACLEDKKTTNILDAIDKCILDSSNLSVLAKNVEHIEKSFQKLSEVLD